ncbi:MAG: hypothetical protein LBP79_07745 [Clostridiales bacterium]|nr:hypothetical protein [Clostridiales bacterium]
MYNLLLNSDFSVGADDSPLYYVDENNLFTYDNFKIYGARTCSLTLRSASDLNAAYGADTRNRAVGTEVDLNAAYGAKARNRAVGTEVDLSAAYGAKARNRAVGNTLDSDVAASGLPCEAIMYYEPFLESKGAGGVVFGLRIRAVEISATELYAEFFDAAFKKIHTAREDVGGDIGCNFSTIGRRFKTTEGAAYFRVGIKIGSGSTAVTLFRPFAHLVK